MNRNYNQRGAANSWLIVAIISIVFVVLTTGIMTWSLINYFDQKNNVDTKVAAAEATARKEQADEDEAKFAEREKEPNRQFVGPEDYGRLTFNYPKTWSVYVNKDVEKTGSTYEAYLNPISVPPVSATQQYALRVLIEDKDYDKVISGYQAAVKKGDLKTSAVKAGDVDGTRLDGTFSKDIRGSAVVFKIRDKTVTLRSDAETFAADFNALASTIKFNE